MRRIRLIVGTPPPRGIFFLGGFQMKSLDEEDLSFSSRLFSWKPSKKEISPRRGGGGSLDQGYRGFDCRGLPETSSTLYRGLVYGGQSLP